MEVIGQSGCFREKVLVFLQKLLYSGKSGFIRSKLLYSGKNCSIWLKWLYSTKVVLFVQSG